MSTYNENGVPVLFLGDGQKIGLSEDGHKSLTKTRDAALKAADKADGSYLDHLLIGESVTIHCPHLRGSGEEGSVRIQIGAETLDEAVKSCIGLYDLQHSEPLNQSSDHLHPPEWVSSTHPKLAEHLADYWSIEPRPADIVNLRTNVGLDIASAGVFNFSQGGAGSTIGGWHSGTATTAPTATTFTTDGVNWPANALTGQVILTAARMAIVQSNTSATNSVATVDRWYDLTALPADPGVAAASTPAAAAYFITGAQANCAYMALANNATATSPNVTDTSLTGEITTASGGLIRKLGTYAHSASSAGSGTVTLTKTWTANGSDSLPVTVSQVGVFQGVVVASSRMMLKTALSANATLTTSGDQVQVTETITVT